MRLAIPMLLMCLAAGTTQPTTRPLTEDQKIEVLIQAVADLKDATFVRNGKEYDSAAAAKHMRDKWQWKKKDIRTARDFIDVAASKSAQSGKPYVIRFKDGSEVTSAEFLNEQLKKLDGSS